MPPVSGPGPAAQVSVIVPTHNRDATLDVAIASIQAQTITDIEIIIAGDGVTPAVRAVIERLSAQDRRVRFLDYDKAPGPGYENRHRALLASTGEYIFYSDDDDLWLPDHVEKLSKALFTADVVDSAVVSIARSGRIHRAFANHSHPAQRQLLAATGERKIIFDTHIAHRRSLYFRLGGGWERGVADLLSGFAASDAIWATFNRPTALSLHGSVRNHETPLQRREEVLRLAAGLSGLDVEGEAIGVWYLNRMLQRVPPAKDEGFQSYLDRMGIARCGVPDGGIAIREAIEPKMTAEALADMEMTFGLFQGAIEEQAPLHRILLPLVEPLLGGPPRTRYTARAMRRALSKEQAQKFVSEISTDRPHDLELKILLRAELLLRQRNAEEAFPLLEHGSEAFSRYAPNAMLMLAHHAMRDGRPDESVRRLRDANERWGPRTDVRLALGNALWQVGQSQEAIELLDATPWNEEVANLAARIREGIPLIATEVHVPQQQDLSGKLLGDMRDAFRRRDWGATFAGFESFRGLSKVGKGRRVEAASLAARAYVAVKERAHARNLLKDVAGIGYNKPQHYEYLARAFLDLKKYAEAAKYCRKAEQLAAAARE